MHNILFSALIALLSTTAVSHAAGALPVVSADDFTVGKQWTWDYREASGAMFSTERYTVIAKSGSTVVLEMASDYRGGQDLKSHHRIEVDIARCLSAYRNPATKTAWSFRMFYLDAGHWMPVDQDNTLAFEEKFNCNPHVFAQKSDRYATVFAEIAGQRAFQQKLWRKLESSWFALDGVNAGVGVYKDFMNGPTRQFSMTLRN